MSSNYWAAVRFENTYYDYDALIKCGHRYRHMVAANPELQAFIGEFIEAAKQRHCRLELNRWLGYIQGTVIASGITTVEVERNWTRDQFRPLLC